jgi:small-conductance mechanosensitive channel
MESAIPTIENPLGNALLHAAIYAAVTVLFFILSRWVLTRWAQKLAKKTTTTIDDQLLRASTKPFGILVVLVGLNYTVNAFSPFLSEGLNKHIDGVLYVLIVTLTSLWVMRLFTGFFNWYAEVIALRTESTADDEFIPLINRLTKIVIGTITIIIILKHFNQDVQSLVVSLGVGSLAIALAAQETLSNMIAGFVIMTDRPFRMGDRIELSDGKVGDVYQIGLRSTKLLTFDNTLVIVPNSEIVKERVINRSYPDPLIRVRIDVGVSYNSDIDQVKAILTETFKNHPDILEEPEPKAYFLEFGDSSLNFMVQGRVDSWKKQFTVSDELRGMIIKRFRQEGIEIPFPQRDIWVRTQPLEHRVADEVVKKR